MSNQTGPTGPTGVGIKYILIKNYSFYVYNSDNSLDILPIMGNINCNTGKTGIGVEQIILNHCGDLTTLYTNGDFRPSGKIYYTTDDAPTGWTGYTGNTGYTGESSTPNIFTGYTGYIGHQGPINIGPTGIIGPPGIDNIYFYTGYIGWTGYTGQTGVTGNTGGYGINTFDGSTGPTGYTGMTGDTGATGDTSTYGSTGYKGLTGTLGYTGPIGPQISGPTGSYYDYFNGTGYWCSGTGYQNMVNQLRQPSTFQPQWFGFSGTTGANTSSIILGTRSNTPNNGQDTIAIGYNAGLTNQMFGSISVGYEAGYHIQQGFGIGIGWRSGYSQFPHCIDIGNTVNIPSDLNINNQASIFIGNATSKSFQTNSVCIGNITNLLSISNDIYIGDFPSITSNISYNISIGSNSDNIVKSGEGIAIGYQCGTLNQGNGAIAIGSYSHSDSSDTLPSYNIGIGYSAARYNQHFYSIAIGTDTGNSYQEPYSISIGCGSGFTGQSESSVALGYQSGYYSQKTQNVAIGYQCAYNLQSSGSVAIGYQCQYTGSQNYSIGIGYKAGYYSQGTGTILIGNYSGYTFSNSNSVAIGTNTSYTGIGENSISIGYNSGQIIPTDNTFNTIQNMTSLSSGSTLYYDNTSGQIGPLVSTRRMKTNIHNLDDTVDTKSILNNLKPVSFNYTNNPNKTIGLIAESVHQVYPKLTTDISVYYSLLNILLLKQMQYLINANRN